jgi:hypothetical protein
MIKNMKIFSFLIALIMFCIVIQVVEPISAANSNNKLVDKGVAPLKNSNIININWKVYDFYNKKVEIYKYYTKNNTKTKYQYNKIIIKPHSKKKLSISTIHFSKKTASKQIKFVKTKFTPKYYYLKVYKSKMLKNVELKKVIDSGKEDITNLPHGVIKWKTNIYYNKKVAISENINYLGGKNSKTILFERYSKNKLKMTVKSVNRDTSASSSSNNPSKNKAVKYVKTDLNPKNYYFNVYKAKMLKNVPKIYKFEEGFGLLKNSETRFFWAATSQINKNFVRTKLLINRGFSFGNLTYDKILIELVDTNKLKIIYEINNIKEIKLINTTLYPLDYYFKIYRPNMFKIFNQSTIVIVPK